MLPGSPFKFLDSYHKEDREIFFGRDHEIEEVYNKIFQGKTLFIYGESGTGKSSLINCGLANRFDDEDWLPVNVRRGNNINESVLKELNKIAITEVASLNGSFANNLDKYTRSIYLDYFKPIYFIFDQFEELYLLGNPKEWNEFISGVRALAETDLFVHFIFIIRSEYLHFMAEFEEEFREIFSNKMRIEKVTRQQAIDCIEGPCKVVGIEVEDRFAENLLHRLSPDRTEIELTYLQVFLDRIFKEASEKAKGDKIKFENAVLDELGKIGDVLSDFLEQQIATFSNADNALVVLKSFVTLEGTKKQLDVDEISQFVDSLGFRIDREEIDDIINELIKKRILKDKDENDKYELRHDSLALKIYEKITHYEKELIEVQQFIDYAFKEHQRRAFLLNESDLGYIAPFEEKLNLAKEVKYFLWKSKQVVKRKKQSRKRITIVGTVIVVLLVSSLVLLGYSLRQKAKADELALVASRESEIARQQSQFAQEQRQIAIDNEKLAQEQANRAQAQSQIAEEASRKAEVARIDAETQRQQAIIQRQNAVLAQGQAEENAEEALRQRNIADEERKNAERLRLLSLAQALGAKSIQARDIDTRAFMAAQAYRYNQQFEGYPLTNEIYNGLYRSVLFLMGTDFNSIWDQTDEVRTLVSFGNGIASMSIRGRFLKHVITDTQITIENDIDLNLMTRGSGPYLSVFHTAIMVDGRLIAGTEDGWLIVLDIDEETVAHEEQVLTDGDGFWEMVRDPQSGSIFTISIFGSIHRWSTQGILEGGELQRNLLYRNDTSTAKINAIDVDPDGNLLFNEGGLLFSIEMKNLNAREPAEPNVLMEMDPEKEITRFKISPDGSILAVGFKDGSIQLFDYLKGILLASLPGHTTQVSDIAFSPDGALMASGSYDKSLKIWNLENFSILPTVVDDFDSWVLSVTFGSNGKSIITGEANGQIRYFTLELSEYYNQICSHLKRNMTPEEWALIVGDEFEYSETCVIEENEE